MFDHSNEGFYVLRVNLNECVKEKNAWRINISVNSTESTCESNVVACVDCIGSFEPGPGKYILSAWTKGEYSNRNTTYVNPSISVSFSGSTETYTFEPSGQIIDGWQRIDGIVTVPADGVDGIDISFYCQTGVCLFDDIRFVPVNGNMVSYVYDPVTLKLVAKLDERNYSSLYEYDEEGKLIRTKKETEKGIMTIQENRDNIHKR